MAPLLATLVPVGLTLVVLGAGLALVRHLRSTGALPCRKGRCERCGRSGPVAHVKLARNTGMIVMFKFETVAATVCRPCGLRLFGQVMLHTLVLGWWGLISFFVNLAFVANNLAHLLLLLALPASASVAPSALEEHREYAQNLLATKDAATVVDVLCRSTGASRPEVERFLASIGADDASA